MKKYKYILVAFLFLFSSNLNAQGQDWTPVAKTSDSARSALIQSFQAESQITIPKIIVPTIVQANFDINSTNNYFGVYNETSKSFVPFITTEIISPGTAIAKISELIQNSYSGTDLYALHDGRSETTKDFYLKGDSGSTNLNILYSGTIKADTLTLNLAENVKLPDYITITAIVGNAEIVILNNFKPNSQLVKFPQTEAKDWSIIFTYSQPTRISEISLNNITNQVSTIGVKFLALPQNTYKIYSNQESYINTFEGQEVGNLYNGVAVMNLGLTALTNNSAFVPKDTDKDGIEDNKDNCQNIANADQLDVNKNGTGDVCDDFDNDGVINSVDNCLEVANSDQRNTDGDAFGDKCDSDESRLTEKYPFIVWFGIGLAALVFLTLLYVAADRIRKNNLPTPPANFPPTPPLA
jgi:hypothetical protein